MLDEPDFAQSRRFLRRARIQDAVQLPGSNSIVRTHRDRLLELLSTSSAAEVVQFERLTEEQVDTIVSLALAAVPEAADSSINVLLACLKVLVEDGQFARVASLAVRLESHAKLRTTDRPYWATALAGLAHALRGETADATRIVEDKVAGRGEDDNVQKPRDSRQLDDVLALASIRLSLQSDDWAEYLGKTQELARGRANGELLIYLEALSSWKQAKELGDPVSALAAVDPVFRQEQLRGYLARRNISSFFPSQLRAVQAGMTQDRNTLVALPTSSGKTLLAELRIAAALIRSPGGKAIYVAPYRLLSRQVARELKHLEQLGFATIDLGDGFDPTASGLDDTADVLVCTPERLDALFRLASSQSEGYERARAIFDSTAVLVFDELHLLGRSGRGVRFEMLLTRLRDRYPRLPILGLSAAAQESSELATWLGDSQTIKGARRPTGTIEILWDHADGTLIQRVPRKKPAKVGQLERTGTAIDSAASLLLRLARKYSPTLAVCVQRTYAEGLARRVFEGDPLAGESWAASLNPSDLRVLTRAIEEIRSILGDDHPLATYLEAGIAFHHAGLPTHALRRIEELAARRLVRVVCATTTVAEGADLPFLAVVIPHLNFQGESRRLDRDLYLNIIGRAGRANVSVEGMVFVLGSRALQSHVREELWTDSAGRELAGRVGRLLERPNSVEAYAEFLDFQSQILGWLGDGNSYVEDQSAQLARKTLSWQGGSPATRSQIIRTVDLALRDLEEHGFAVAGSPYRLTEIGTSARLTGLSAPSVRRLNAATDRSRAWLADLESVTRLSATRADLIAEIVFEAVEVYEHSLAARRLAGTVQQEKLRQIANFCSDRPDNAHRDTPEFAADIAMLSAWVQGDSYAQIAEIAPAGGHASALFGGSDHSKKVSDASDYLGKLSYPSSWAWSAVSVLSSVGASLPDFIRGALEFGLPTESSVRLAQDLGLTRGAALTVAELGGDSWRLCRTWLLGDDVAAELSPHLTLNDLDRIDRYLRKVERA